MFKVKIKSNLRTQIANKLRNTVDSKFISDVNAEVVGEAKRMIASGSSPVKTSTGERRFAKYKNEKNYPGQKDRRLKPSRPVNLFLSGEMLSFYKAMKVNGVRLSIGILPFAPKKVKDRAVANNEGTTNKTTGEVAIAARRFVPLAGESFTTSVMRKLKNVYAQRIKALLSK